MFGLTVGLVIYVLLGGSLAVLFRNVLIAVFVVVSMIVAFVLALFGSFFDILSAVISAGLGALIIAAAVMVAAGVLVAVWALITMGWEKITGKQSADDSAQITDYDAATED